jgi:hypothetical protein
MPTYSFLDTNASLVGPGGAINLGQGAATAEEGITIEPAEDIGSMRIGADGSVMHSLHANKAGTVTVHLLKTSPVNQKLMQMYVMQTASSANHGLNTFNLYNANTQDTITANRCAFKRAPTLTYAKEGGLNDWVFNAGEIDRALGAAT